MEKEQVGILAYIYDIIDEEGLIHRSDPIYREFLYEGYTLNLDKNICLNHAKEKFKGDEYTFIENDLVTVSDAFKVEFPHWKGNIKDDEYVLIVKKGDDIITRYLIYECLFNHKVNYN